MPQIDRCRNRGVERRRRAINNENRYTLSNVKKKEKVSFLEYCQKE